MSTAIATHADAVEQSLVSGNIGALTQPDRLIYYDRLCKSLGLNPLTQPFEYLTLNGKVRLYARKDCTDQLRSLKGVSVTKLEKERIEDVYAVTAYVQDKDGRTDSAVGAVPILNLKGEALANALMKCETKAKRRATLSICGLGFLDETELETIKGVQVGDPTEKSAAEKALDCEDCGKEVDAITVTDPGGEDRFYTLEQVKANAQKHWQKNLCGNCQRDRVKKATETKPQLAAQPEKVDVLAAESEMDKKLAIFIDDEEGRAQGIIQRVYKKDGKKPFQLILQAEGLPETTRSFSSFHVSHEEAVVNREGQKIVLWYEVTVKNNLTYRNIKEIESIDGKPLPKSDEPF